MPAKHPIAGLQHLFLPATGGFRRAIQYGIAILICLTALDTAATPARPPRLVAAVAPLEAGPARTIRQVLRMVSAFVGAAHPSQAAAVRKSTIIGFRG